MGRIRAIALLTVAIAARVPATAATAAAAGHPVRSRPAVPARVGVEATIAVSSQPIGSPRTRRPTESTWANDGGDTVSVISGRADTAVATVPVGRVPAGVATDPRTRPSGCGACGAKRSIASWEERHIHG